MKKLKLISTILLSVILLFTISTAVFADGENEDIWSEPTVEENNTTENTNNTETDENLFNNVEVDNNTDDNEEYNNLYNTTNNTSTISNSENLADTGIEDSGVIALVIMISVVVAIYSAKKFNEYKNV